MNQNRIEPLEIEKEMRKSYLDYAMSVIVGRALPLSLIHISEPTRPY